MQLLLAASNHIAANNQSRKHHVYAVENVNTGAAILHLTKPKHLKKHPLVKSDVIFVGWACENHLMAIRGNLQNPAQSAKGEERGDHERNPWLAKMVSLLPEQFP